MLFLPRKSDISSAIDIARRANLWLPWKRRLHHKKFDDAELPVARLNVDFKKEGTSAAFRALKRRLKDDAGAAWERYLRFMDIAQDWYCGYAEGAKGTALGGISPAAFDLEGDLGVMIEVGYAFRSDDGSVHAVGEKNRFHWLISKKKGGLASADRARNEDGTFAGGVEDGCPSDAGQMLDDSAGTDPADAGQLPGVTPSINPGSFTLSSSLSSSQQTKSPLSPPAAAALPTRRELDRQANHAATQALATGLICLNAFLENRAKDFNPAGAKKALDPRSWALVTKRYDNWPAFIREFYAARRGNRDGSFRRDVESSFKALLPEVLAEFGREPTGPPEGEERPELS